MLNDRFTRVTDVEREGEKRKERRNLGFEGVKIYSDFNNKDIALPLSTSPCRD